MHAKAREVVRAWGDMPVRDISPPYVFTYTKEGVEQQYVGKSDDLVDVCRRCVNTVCGFEGVNQCTGREWLGQYLPNEYKRRLT